MLSKLKNPLENIVTSSFKIETYSDDGWKLDEISQNVTINFYCNYPCASCNEDDEEQFSAALQQAINESNTEAAQREELRAKEAVASAHAQSAGPAPQWRPRCKGDTGKRKANP